jgi:hypothetical protein
MQVETAARLKIWTLQAQWTACDRVLCHDESVLGQVIIR